MFAPFIVYILFFLFMWIQLFQLFVCTLHMIFNKKTSFIAKAQSTHSLLLVMRSRINIYRLESVSLLLTVSCFLVHVFLLCTNVPLNEMDANTKSNYIYFYSLFTLILFLVFSFVVHFLSLSLTLSRFNLVFAMRFASVDFIILENNTN